MKMKKKQDAEYLNGPDISICQQCGDHEHIWHIWGKGDEQGKIVGVLCTRCLWTCGKTGLISAIVCKFNEPCIRIKRVITHGEEKFISAISYKFKELRIKIKRVITGRN